MKSLVLHLQIPSIFPKKSSTLYDRFWLRIMNDKRDCLLFICLQKSICWFCRLAILLFTPVLTGWWWWAVAVPYFYVSQLYFKGRFGLMFHCLCHRKTIQSTLTSGHFMHISPGYFAHCLAMLRKDISAITWECTILKTICRMIPAVPWLTSGIACGDFWPISLNSFLLV